jgi:hypothetical protein
MRPSARRKCNGTTSVDAALAESAAVPGVAKDFLKKLAITKVEWVCDGAQAPPVGVPPTADGYLCTEAPGSAGGRTLRAWVEATCPAGDSTLHTFGCEGSTVAGGQCPACKSVFVAVRGRGRRLCGTKVYSSSTSDKVCAKSPKLAAQRILQLRRQLYDACAIGSGAGTVELKGSEPEIQAAAAEYSAILAAAARVKLKDLDGPDSGAVDATRGSPTLVSHDATALDRALVPGTVGRVMYDGAMKNVESMARLGSKHGATYHPAMIRVALAILGKTGRAAYDMCGIASGARSRSRPRPARDGS